jgi:hypothetical protein
MRAQDFVTEFSDTDPGVKRSLEKRGYRFLGQGVDQMAFAEPGTGHVLKIFGTQCNQKGGTPALSPDQKMFKTYAEFCAKNQDNPYLPRIYGWETFVWKNKVNRATPSNPIRGEEFKEDCLYLQIRTERLRPVSNKFSRFYEAMGADVAWGRDFRSFHKDMESSDVQDWYSSITDNPESIQRMKKLYDTMQTLYKIGERRNFSWDLHGGNVMQRSDGTPVITDPWVV